MAERSEKATGKKRKDQRKKGNVFQSKDVTALVSIFVTFLFLKSYFPFVYRTISGQLQTFFNFLHTQTQMTQSFLVLLFKQAAGAAIACILPLAFLSIIVAIISTGAQTKFLFSAQSIRPQFSKLDPLKGIARMFSLKSGVELLKNIIKVAVVSYILYGFVQKQYPVFLKTLDMSIMQTTALTLSLIFDMAMRIGAVFVAIAGLDYFFQWWNYEKDMRMSKQEVKEEYKQTEGDPQIKGKIKERQRKMANARMMQAVPSADVVIRNPTHFAVALKYQPDKSDAPFVVAKGQDELALRIVSIAQQHGVTTIENKPLARALYSQTEINQTIPYEHFAAVAEILAMIYKLQDKQLY